jgi:hypothetical protein
LVPLVVPHHLLQEQVLALLQAKVAQERNNGNGLPHEPVGRLHLAEHEGLHLGTVKDGGLVLDVRVESLDQHGVPRQLLQLHIVFLLHHAVEAGIEGPQRSRSKFLLQSKILEELRERLLARGTRLKIEIRNVITKLGPHPPAYCFLRIFFELGKHLLIRSNGGHGRKERDVSAVAG